MLISIFNPDFKAEQENAQVNLIELTPFSEVFTEKIIKLDKQHRANFLTFATCHVVQTLYIYSKVMVMQLSTSLIWNHLKNTWKCSKISSLSRLSCADVELPSSTLIHWISRYMYMYARNIENTLGLDGVEGMFDVYIQITTMEQVLPYAKSISWKQDKLFKFAMVS